MSILDTTDHTSTFLDASQSLALGIATEAWTDMTQSLQTCKKGALELWQDACQNSMAYLRQLTQAWQ